MIADLRCSDCGAEIPVGAPEGLCTKCLYLLALDPQKESANPGETDLGPILARPHSAVGVKFHRFGDYELLEEIARGGMGVVFRARQSSLNRHVALKLVLGGRLASPVIVKRFQVEAEAAASLRHPNIVAIYEIGERDGHHYYSMELVGGTGLDRQIATLKVPHAAALTSEDRATVHHIQIRIARLMISIASAVDYAHQHGVLHRDLKPSNILIDGEGEPHLADFGLAKLADRGVTQFTLSGAVMGTPSYMAPELASGHAKQATTAADIYSLGAILYELLSGTPPFQAETPVEIWRRALEEEPKHPTILNKLVDHELATVCLKCLEKDPQRRYPSARALAEDLERWLEGEPIAARPATTADRLWRWCRRRPALSGLTGTAVLLFFAGLIGVSTQWRRAEQEARNARQNLYAADMGLVQQALKDGNLGRARQLLDAHNPSPGHEDLRRFEWRLFRHLAQGDYATAFSGHSDSVRWVAFSPNGKLLATAGADRLVKLWDLDRHRLSRALTNHADGVNGLAFSPDNRFLATASEDGLVMVWNTATWQITNQLKAESKAKPRHIAFSPGEPVLVFSEGLTLSSGLGHVTLWNYVTGERVARLERAGSRVAFAPDGQTFLTGNEDSVTLREAATGRDLWTVHQRANIVGLAVSPDGKKFATSNFGGDVRVYDMSKPDAFAPLRGHSARVWSIAFSPDGTRLGGGSSDQMIYLWDVSALGPTNLPLQTLRGHGSEVHCLAFSPDGKFLASGDKQGAVLLWDLQAQPNEQAVTRALVTYTNPPPVFSRDGKLMAAMSGTNEVTLWQVRTLERVRSFPATCIPLAISDDHETLTVLNRDYAFERWNVDNGTLQYSNQFVHSKYASAARLSARRRVLAIGYATGALALWQAETGKELWNSQGHKTATAIREVTFSPDERLVATAGRDNLAKIWDVDAGKEVLTLSGHRDGVFSVAFSPNGKMLATASIDGTARLWDLATGKQLSVFVGHKEGLFRVVFAPDAETLATASDDRTVRLWNLVTKREVARLEHRGAVFTVGFAPNGDALVSSALGGTIHRWLAPEFAEIDATERRKAARE